MYLINKKNVILLLKVYKDLIEMLFFNKLKKYYSSSFTKIFLNLQWCYVPLSGQTNDNMEYI